VGACAAARLSIFFDTSIEMSETCDMADGGDSEVNSDREVDANAADADVDDDEVIAERYNHFTVHKFLW